MCAEPTYRRKASVLILSTMAMCGLLHAVEAEAVDIQIHFSHMPLIRMEARFHFLLRVTNRSGEALPIISPPMEAVNRQLLLSLDAGAQSGAGASREPTGIPWDVLTQSRGLVRIPAGGEHIIACSDDELVQGIGEAFNGTYDGHLIVRLQVGDGEWAEAIQPFSIVDRTLSDTPALHEIPFALRRRPDYTIRFHHVELGGNRILMRTPRAYVCHIPADTTPSFAYNRTQKTMEISFGGRDGASVVYDVQSARVVRGSAEATPAWYLLAEWQRSQHASGALRGTEGR